MYVLTFLCIRTIVITSEIPTFGKHIPGEAGTASGLSGNRRILVLHSRAGRYSPVSRPIRESARFPGRPEHNKGKNLEQDICQLRSVDGGELATV